MLWAESAPGGRLMSVGKGRATGADTNESRLW
jgi:hypothetical protein